MRRASSTAPTDQEQLDWRGRQPEDMEDDPTGDPPDGEALRLIAEFIHHPWHLQGEQRQFLQGLGLNVENWDPARAQLMDDMAQVCSACWKRVEGKLTESLQKGTAATIIALQELAKDRASQDDELKHIRMELSSLRAQLGASNGTTGTAALGAENQEGNTKRLLEGQNLEDPPTVWEECKDLDAAKTKYEHLVRMRNLKACAGETLHMHVHTYTDHSGRDGHNSLHGIARWWYELEVQRGSGLLADIVDSKLFQAFCIVIILLHACLSTLGLNAEMRHALSRTSDPQEFSRYEQYFLIWYCVEVFARILAHRLHFFIGEECGWNLFDFCLVLQGLVDEALIAFDTGNVLILRPLRLLKVVRVLRSVRAVRFLQELRLMVVCIIQSMQTLVWCLTLLVFIQYFFSVFLVQGMIDFINDSSDDVMNGDMGPAIETYFQSVQRSVLTLWMAVTGGEDWGPLYHIVKRSGDWSAQVFIFYTAFFILSAFNIVTGTFVNKAFNIAKPDPDMQAKIRNIQEAEFAKRLTQLFRHADKDNSGGLQKEQLVHIFEHERHAILEILGVSNVDTDALYDLLDLDEESDELNIDAFVTGLLMLSGPGRNIDIHLAEHRIMNTLEMVQSNMNKMCQQLHLTINR